mmetsp:Transcript_19336/g.46101  ORF Transcript_19336/g.46101 Transcript_19336/m.46101 type:complete len:362 (-) Transcript_19336:430-1515(-)
MPHLPHLRLPLLVLRTRVPLLGGGMVDPDRLQISCLGPAQPPALGRPVAFPLPRAGAVLRLDGPRALHVLVLVRCEGALVTPLGGCVHGRLHDRREDGVDLRADGLLEGPLHVLADKGELQELDGGGPRVRVRAEHRADERAELPREVRRERLVRVAHDLNHQLGHPLGLERRLAGSHLIQDAPEGPYVRLGGVGPVRHQLRRHVVGGPHHGGRHLEGIAHVLGDSEVPDPHDRVAFIQEDVSWLEVPVDYVFLVQVVDRERELDEPVHDLLLRQRDARVHAPQQLGEGAALAVSHDDAEDPLRRVEVPLVGDEVRVPAGALHHLDLVEDLLLLVQLYPVELLDDDLLVRALVPGCVDSGE